MIQECCKKMGKLGSKLLIYPKREFFLKNNYHYLCLSSTPKLGPNCPFASLWQNWLLLLSTYCILSFYSISKKSWTSNSWDRRCAEGWPKLGPSYFPKRNIFANFFGNVDQHCFGRTIVSHHAMPFQKNCHGADHVKVA